MQEVKVDMEQLLDHVMNDKPISIARMREWLKHLVGDRAELIKENERLLGMKRGAFNVELEKRVKEVIIQLAADYPDIRGDISIKVEFVSK